MLEPLTPQVFHILLALADAPRHGYAIMREVEERTGGAVRIGAGTLYGAIRRLRDQGWIEELAEAPAEVERGDERRRYYRLTGAGRAGARAEAERLERLLEQARSKRFLRSEGRA